MLHTSIYAFIPFAVLFGLALVTALVSIFPGRADRGPRIVPRQAPLPTAEIIAFPTRATQFAIFEAGRRAVDGSR